MRKRLELFNNFKNKLFITTFYSLQHMVPEVYTRQCIKFVSNLKTIYKNHVKSN